MEGMFEIEVVYPRWKDKTNVTRTIAVSIAMGLRLSEDVSGVCWITMADNSHWQSPHDYETTRDKISGILRHL